MTVSNTVVPLPTPPFVVYYGEMFNPLLIALVGGIGTCIACLIEYTLLSYAFKYTAEKSEKLASLKDTRTYQHTIRIFNKVPFISIAIAAFTPIPFDPIRLLAIAAKYNRLKYSISIFIGRAPRYFLLASLGERLTRLECNLHINAFLLGSILVAIAIFVITKIFKGLRRKTFNELQQKWMQNLFRRKTMKNMSVIEGMHILGRCIRNYATSKPLVVSFEVTHSCTANCQHCDKGGRREFA